MNPVRNPKIQSVLKAINPTQDGLIDHNNHSRFKISNGVNLTSQVVVKDLLRKYNIRPFKGFGQNFLISENILKKIVEVANVSPEDIILEIGSGIGTLTQELARKVKRVITIEKDEKMVEILKETLVDFKNVKVIEGDALKLNPKNYKLRTKNYKLIANLPYNITSPVIRKFLESGNPPKEMILMVQKEVAQRICAKPPAKGEVRPKGRPKMNLLAVSVQFYSKPEILFYVSKNSFWPSPKVDSALIKITLKKVLQRPALCDLFFKIVRAGFSQPRKQILNNLSKVLKLDKETIKFWLLENGINPNQRAETLKIEDWIKLTNNYK
jgi:16S rRNA (adenine1518-N6/adenine1519-N6)-dimethyltransferase